MQMQDRTDAVQVGCWSGRMQDRMDAGKDRFSTGKIQEESDAGQEYTLQEYTDAGQERYRTYSWPKDHKQTGRMQYRSATEEDEFRTGQMQNR